jgi:precorrin-2 methylase
MEQAARGHDIVALKIHGESARLNFPVDQYKTILPVVNGHTEQELINAVLKDAELAMQRTTKFKGVRKTGPNHYEATVDKDMVTRALQQNAKHEKKAAADGDAPAVHHKVSTFHCA